MPACSGVTDVGTVPAPPASEPSAVITISSKVNEASLTLVQPPNGVVNCSSPEIGIKGTIFPRLYFAALSPLSLLFSILPISGVFTGALVLPLL